MPPTVPERASSLGRLCIHRTETPIPTNVLRKNADGTLPDLTPGEIGQSETYPQTPFRAMHDIQINEGNREVPTTCATESNLPNRKWASEDERSVQSTASSLSRDMEELKGSVTIHLLVASAAAATSPFLIGYNVAVMNAVQDFVFPDHSLAGWSFAVAAFAIGGPFGASVAGDLANSLGRRKFLIIVAWTFAAGGLVQTFAQNLPTISLARFIIGIASGFTSVLTPIYLGELAPPNLRGAVGTLNQFADVIGVLVANLVSIPFGNSEGWRKLFSITVFVALLQLLVTPWVVESPRWILSHDPNNPRAKQIVKDLRGHSEDHKVEKEVRTYIAAGRAQSNEDQPQGSVLSEMWKKPSARLMLFSCLCLHLLQQLSGINAVFYYSTAFFDGIIEDPLMGTIIVGVVNAISTYTALLLMDSHGRKKLLIVSATGMIFACFIIMLSQHGILGNLWAVLGVNVYVAFFEIGLGPIPWLIVAEMFESKYVTVAMTLCCQLNWVCNSVVGMAFPTMAEYLGPNTFLPSAAELVITIIFVLVVLPETQGTTPEKLAKVLAKKFPTVVVEPDKEEGSSSMYTEWKHVIDSHGCSGVFA